MFNINDYVVYNATGVFKIIDIRREHDILDKETEYYVLQPAYNNNLTIKIPVNAPRVSMRLIMTKDEVLSLIASMPDIEALWINDDRERNERFKTALKTANSEEWAKLIKTIYLQKQEKIDIGKKLAQTDENIMKAAEKNLYEEFAIALNITPDEVVSYITERVPS
ncbi:CarD family transcriptional regulator [Dehalobacter sp. DCM]|uniref:CarD family transcriptional regulator n=1 Tax=Dehalobacter sp. DCM TaxID=2907827 RepID=UPI0030816618|nr:CarD family transcriptional regulator [Dehalobacter sp. DCM]